MTLWIEIEGVRRRVELGEPGPDGSTACLVDGEEIQVNARLFEAGVMSLVTAQGRQMKCLLDHGDVVIDGWRYSFAEVDPRSLRSRRGAGAGTAGPRALKAPMPGKVVRLLVEVGAEVEEHQGIVVIEAMKMQNELRSPKAGRVSQVAVSAGDTVASGDVLVMVE